MFKTILFPIDKSREAREAAETVIKLVQSFQSRLVLLSVVESSKPEDREGVMNSEEAVAKLLQGAHELFAQAGIEADTIEREGMPSFTICDVADEIEADLIVMGCRGMGLTQEGVAESVTSKVINLAPCPVLIIP
ncbi:universal stress protein [Synechococcus moorigangaii CMS01]|nr:universal stress protein [Synechococcus moorigangaii CMS01]